MVSDDEYLERIVAGIHAVTTADADVSWNEVINDRQFDVVVRFTLGTLRYLVLVEVKNRARKAAASDMDAFVLKARDQNANKAVFVTAAGFQRGAIRVAKRHGVDLFTVTFDEERIGISSQAQFLLIRKQKRQQDISPSVIVDPADRVAFSIGEPTLVANIEKMTLVYADGKRFGMPGEQSQMTYYMKKTALRDGRTLEDVIQLTSRDLPELDETRRDETCLKPPQHIEPPDDYFFPAGTLASVEYVVTGRQGRPMSGNMLIDPGAFTTPVVYTNVITNQTTYFAIDQLPLGDKRVSVERFYFIPHPLMYYYCASIDGDKVHWHLIESFQSGEKITATIIQDIKYSPHYIPVSDKKTLNRLQHRLDDFRKRLKQER